MKRKDYEALMEKEIFAEIKKTAEVAGIEYANYEENVYDEVFDNFIRHGKTLGLDRKMIWAVYFNKHTDAVLRYIKEDGANEQREDIRGRIIDMILYLNLLYGMITEDKTLSEPAQLLASDVPVKLPDPTTVLKTKKVGKPIPDVDPAGIVDDMDELDKLMKE